MMRMKKKGINPNLSRVWLLVPKIFLQHFDEAVQGTFPSRSEAIRRGMNLVLEEVKRFQSNGPAFAGSPSSSPSSQRQGNAAALPGGEQFSASEKKEELYRDR
jgi:Arc/MetJ-type ribon-helix-helix transcriptional regulator